MLFLVDTRRHFNVYKTLKGRRLSTGLWLIRLNLFNIAREIWRRSLKERSLIPWRLNGWVGLEAFLRYITKKKWIEGLSFFSVRYVTRCNFFRCFFNLLYKTIFTLRMAYVNTLHWCRQRRCNWKLSRHLLVQSQQCKRQNKMKSVQSEL